jgi:hypothetical protein
MIDKADQCGSRFLSWGDGQRVRRLGTVGRERGDRNHNADPPTSVRGGVGRLGNRLVRRGRSASGPRRRRVASEVMVGGAPDASAKRSAPCLSDPPPRAEQCRPSARTFVAAIVNMAHAITSAPCARRAEMDSRVPSAVWPIAQARSVADTRPRDAVRRQLPAERPISHQKSLDQAGQLKLECHGQR